MHPMRKAERLESSIGMTVIVLVSKRRGKVRKKVKSERVRLRMRVRLRVRMEVLER